MYPREKQKEKSQSKANVFGFTAAWKRNCVDVYWERKEERKERRDTY